MKPISLLLLMSAGLSAATVQIADTLRDASGAVWTGQLFLTCGTFVAGTDTVRSNQIKKAVTSGALSMSIEAGSNCTVFNRPSSGDAYTTYWTVPGSGGPYKIRDIETGSLAGTPGSEFPLTFTAPVTRAGNVIGMPASTDSVNGYLTAADHTLLSGKAGTATSNTFGATQDFRSAASTRPVKSAALEPASCVVAEIYFNTATGKMRQCSTPNIWSDLGGDAGLSQLTAFVALGDSITGGNSTPTILQQTSWPAQLAALSGQRFKMLSNAGVTGNTAAQMLARIQADVVAVHPQVCFVMAGTNDVIQQAIGNAGNSPALAKGTLAQIVDILLANGIKPILMTIPPNGYGAALSVDQTALTANTLRMNYEIRDLAKTHGVALIDVFHTLSDPATGFYRAGYSDDQLHPNGLGSVVIANLIASTLLGGGSLSAYSPAPLAMSNIDPGNLLPNATFTANGTPGTPDGWGPFALTQGTYTSSLTSDPAIRGNWFNLAVTGSPTGGFYNPSITTGFSVGDTVSFSGRVKSSGTLATNLRWAVYAYFAGPNTQLAQYFQGADYPSSSVFHLEGVVPAATTAIYLYVQFYSGTSGTVSFAQMRMVNLTTSVTATTDAVPFSNTPYTSQAGEGWEWLFGASYPLAGAATVGNQTRFFQFVNRYPKTIGKFSVSVSAGVAASFISFGVYKSPCGGTSSLMAKTVPASTATAGFVSSAFATPLFLPPGVYWFGLSDDSSGVIYFTNLAASVHNEVGAPRVATGTASTGTGSGLTLPTTCGGLTAYTDYFPTVGMFP